ncbi:MAG: hypothetical protein HY908_00150 [Myxococcales bacterium]|nr:hypothetical protein [Myxococcales bacterium]
MALSSLTCPPPVRKAARSPQLDFALLEAAVEAFDGGRHLEALHKVFRHLLPELTVPEGPSGSFAFAQGSSRVAVKWDERELTVAVPMVRLPAGGGATAALRFLLTKISGSGQLHQPRLHGDDVVLEFRDRITRLHPIKVIEVLRRMPVEADNHDDFMIDQFGAAPLDREPPVPLDAEERARAEVIWRTHWSEVEELVKEAQRKRSLFFLNEVTAYAFYHVRHAVPLGGSLAARLSEAADAFNDTDEDPNKREAALTKCAKTMRSVSADELGKNLGHAHYAISPLADGTPRVLGQHLGAGDYVENVERARATGKIMEAAVALFSTYNFLLARFSWPEQVEAGLLEGLAQASQKPWREAAAALTSQGKALVDAFQDDEADDDEAPDSGGEGVEGAEASA